MFQAHLPVHDKVLVMRSLWTGKIRGEESGNTDPLASHRRIDSLDSDPASCHRLHGYSLTGVSLDRLRACRRFGDLSGLVTDSHPAVSCCWRRGFYRPRCGSNVLVDQYGCFGLSGVRAAIGKLVHHPETKNPACLSGEQGSRKIDDLCQILNYLPASLVRFSSFVMVA